jgi:cytoskeleton protein RodZ
METGRTVLASFGIGARLRQERVGKGLGIDDISRDTRIAPRFLEAIETGDYAILPGLVFTRNFVRQYALILQMDPGPLLAELPKPDESTAPLPDPPARHRSSNRGDRQIRSTVSSAAWLLVLGGTGIAGYMRFNHSVPQAGGTSAHSTVSSPTANPPRTTINRIPPPVPQTPGAAPIPPIPPSDAPVRVSLTAREAAWVQVSADGKPSFTGTLMPNQTKAVSAEGQVRVLTGNAGALTISLNGRTLESLGPTGQVREVRLTAEGPQFRSKAPRPEPDPL